MTATSVLIVCPNAVVRHGLQFVLGQFGIASTLMAGDVDEALTRIGFGDITAVIVDACVPEAGALRILGGIAHKKLDVPVTVLIDTAVDTTLPWGLFQAAVSINDDGRQLLAAVTASEAGGTYLDPTLARRMAQSAPNVTLTPREQQVLALTAEGASNRDIAERLHVSTDTAKTHITNTMRKLGVDSRAAAIAIAYRDGLLNTDQFRVDTRGELPHNQGHWLINDFSENARAVVRYLRDQLGFGLLAVIQHDKDRWVRLQANDTYYDVKPGSVIRWSDTFCSRMVSGEAPRVAHDTSLEPGYASLPNFELLQVGAYLGAPITLDDGENFGTVCAFDPEVQPPASLDRHQRTIEALALLLGRQLSVRQVSPIR